MKSWPNHFTKFSDKCEKCGHVFLFVSNRGLLRYIWEGAEFELDMANHRLDCATIAVLNAVGIKAERNDG